MCAAKRAEAFKSPTGPAVRIAGSGVHHCQSSAVAESMAAAINRFDEKHGTKLCPDCGAPLELVTAEEGGQIEEPYFPLYPLRDQPLPRRSMPASFWACSGCEHCEEI